MANYIIDKPVDFSKKEKEERKREFRKNRKDIRYLKRN